MNYVNTGTVKWFNNRKGYGFIRLDSGDNDVFVHYSAIKTEIREYISLNKNDKVKFEVTETSKGLEARNVVVVKKSTFSEDDLSKWVSYY